VGPGMSPSRFSTRRATARVLVAGLSRHPALLSHHDACARFKPRETVWLNVLTREWLGRLLPGCQGVPTTGLPGSPDQEGCEDLHSRYRTPSRPFLAAQQPEVVAANRSGLCEVTGQGPALLYTGFAKEKFVFDVDGHGRTPTALAMGDQERKKRRTLPFLQDYSASMDSAQPVRRPEGSKEEGHAPAAVVSQFQEVFARKRPLHLIVGGIVTSKHRSCRGVTSCCPSPMVGMSPSITFSALWTWGLR